MKRSALSSVHYGLFLLAALPAGCGGLDAAGKKHAPPSPPSLEESTKPDAAEQEATARQDLPPAPGQAEASPQQIKGDADPFSDMAALSLDAFIDQVVARNPTLAQTTAAWQAAAARYAQVTSLEDPMFGVTQGPASIGSNDVNFAYRVEASQKLPFFGKLALRGKGARAEAAAAGDDVGGTRLQLIEIATIAYYDYYLIERAIAVNEESLRLLRQFRKTADDRFRASQAPQQDLLQADVEIGQQRKRGLTLERMRKVAQAVINTLMHLPPDTPLPPPPKTLKLADSPPPIEELRARALARRPDLQASANRIEAERAALGLARKEYYPDFEVMTAYDAFWQPSEKDLRPMIGVRVNIPLYMDRRRGAVSEARARLAGRIAELASQTDQVNLQVQEAYEQVLESEKSVRLYNTTILPAAGENVKAARTAYAAGGIPFLSLIEAQRNLVGLRDGYYEELAAYHRRRATLERVTGGPLSPPEGGNP